MNDKTQPFNISNPLLTRHLPLATRHLSQMNDKHRPFATLPAIAIGGPPHSGKSVLIYALTKALRLNGISHYVLRACPDGEGDFSQETSQELIKLIRRKGTFSTSFVERVAQDIANRHFPLLVDVGGKPTPEQELIFTQCTHTILLIADRPEQYKQDLAAWQALAGRHNLPIIANLQSSLTTPHRLDSPTSPLQGVINGLERGRPVDGPVFQALLNKITTLFTYSKAELDNHYLSQSPTELTLKLETLAKTLRSPDTNWHPHQLPALWDYLPTGCDLAAYGRGPVWVYASLAMFTHPNQFDLFDVRLGWTKPPTLVVNDQPQPQTTQEGWQATVTTKPGITQVDLTAHSHYVDIDDPAGLPIPTLPPNDGLIINGKLSNWIICAVARQFGFNYRWVAVHYPPMEGSIIIYSTDPAHPLGQLLT